MDLTKLPPLDGWIPIRVVTAETGTPQVDWCHIGKRRFSEPFFEATIEGCLRHPFNLLFRHQLPIDSLVEWQHFRPGLSPSGFIFHMSRCGSTLISQMLAALPRNIVISEAPPIDTVLRLKPHQADEQEKIAWLRGLLSALAQRRNAEEEQFFVKFDSWHIFHLPLIRRAFPDVPWIFLYRSPVEVMISQLRERAVHLVPGLIGLGLPGLDVAAAAQMSPEECCARALSCICESALHQLRTGGRAVNYTELPEAVGTSLHDYFRLECTAADLDQMHQVTRFDAKNPSLYFDKRPIKEVAPLVREMSARWIEPIYAQLEALREKQEPIQPKTAS